MDTGAPEHARTKFESNSGKWKPRSEGSEHEKHVEDNINQVRERCCLSIAAGMPRRVESAPSSRLFLIWVRPL